MVISATVLCSSGHWLSAPDRKGPKVPISQVPVDQAAFQRMMLVSIAPKADRDTGVQFTTKDGLEKKWSVDVVVSLPSRWDSGRADSDVWSVTLTTADDPTGKVSEGDQVWFTNLTAGVMAPEKTENDRIRGGRLFYSATGVESRPAAHRQVKADA